MDPSYELAEACLIILRNDPVVSGFVQNKIYDRVPEKQDRTPNVVSPYISLGPTTVTTDDFDCVDAVEISIQFDVWSFGYNLSYSSEECRAISHAVRKCLNKRDFQLTVNGLVTLNHIATRYLRADDGITNQGAIQFTALVDIFDE